MARHPLWQDSYWLLLMQLYLKKPTGLKPLYSRALVKLAMELHIPPQVLYEQMFRLRQLDTPYMEQLWAKYGKNPGKLSREADLLRRMDGFGQADAFYDGVELNESWEQDFRPFGTATDDETAALTPLHLILTLDLYFRLTPATMVEETPEVKELAKLMKVSPSLLTEVMEVFQFCDPYLNRADLMVTPLLAPCQEVWNRFGNGKPERLAAIAAQMRAYFK